MTDRDAVSPDEPADRAVSEASDTDESRTDVATADQDRQAFLESNELVITDSVAGETVLPGAGEGNDGPTGGAPAEGSPSYDEHDAGGLGSDDANVDDGDDDDAGTLAQPEALDVGLDGQHHDR